jgi:zinc/manganese transport system substrate-binding protein
MKRTAGIIVAVAVILLLAAVAYFFIRSGHGNTTATGTPASASGRTITIVAAEDFYGNIAQQLGGNKVSVTSILSNPNVDPHEYESSVQDGIAITNADIVIENGLQYDTWMDKLIAAAPNPNRIVITAGEDVPDVLPDNPHVWYGIDNATSIARAITDALEKIDPADDLTFNINYTTFFSSIVPLTEKMNEIKTRYGGTPVALTETIYLYQTEPMDLDVLTPFSFEKAIAEGNDPSAADVNATDQEITGRNAKVLIYNSQTVTPVTSNLQAAAAANGIPIVPVTETMPATDTYQSWMMDEMDALEAALAQ